MMFGTRMKKSERYAQQQERMVVAFKYIVPPGEGEGFVDAWKALEAETTREKGNTIFDLKKTETDNIMFFEYAEWQQAQDFMDHFEQGYTQEFVDYCAENGIVWMMKMLKAVVDDPDTPSARNDRTTKGLTHVLVRYFVPGDKHEDFMDTFHDTAKQTWKEPGNRIFALRKSMTNNLEFWGYGTWESLEDYMDHIETEHVHQLHQFARDNGIVWCLSPMYKIGEQPEALF